MTEVKEEIPELKEQRPVSLKTLKIRKPKGKETSNPPFIEKSKAQNKKILTQKSEDSAISVVRCSQALLKNVSSCSKVLVGVASILNQFQNPRLKFNEEPLIPHLRQCQQTALEVSLKTDQLAAETNAFLKLLEEGGMVYGK